MFSGTEDRLVVAAAIAAGAAAMGMEVEVFLTLWGLNAFRKGQGDGRVSRDYEDMAPGVLRLIRERLQPWQETLRRAKEAGKVRVHACAMTYDLMGLRKEDLLDIVDDVIGVGEFVEMARGADITLFI